MPNGERNAPELHRRHRRALLAADRGEWMRTPRWLRSLIGDAVEVREVVRFEVGSYTELLHDCRAS